MWKRERSKRWAIGCGIFAGILVGCGTAGYEQRMNDARSRSPAAPAGDDGSGDGSTAPDMTDRGAPDGRGGARVGGGAFSMRKPIRHAEALGHGRNIAVAILNYEAATGAFPQQAKLSSSGQPLLSWRVLILPYMEEQALYGQFNMNEPWDSPQNLPLVQRMPTNFDLGDADEPGYTAALALMGPDTLFPGGEKKIRVGEVRDGTSRTIAFVIASPDRAVPWTKPEDINSDPANPTNGLGDADGQMYFAFADGGVMRVSESVDPTAVNAAATRSGGETVDMSVFR